MFSQNHDEIACSPILNKLSDRNGGCDVQTLRVNLELYAVRDGILANASFWLGYLISSVECAIERVLAM